MVGFVLWEEERRHMSHGGSGASWPGADAVLTVAYGIPGAAGKDRRDVLDVAVDVGCSGVPAVRVVVGCEPGYATTGPWLLFVEACVWGGGGARVGGCVMPGAPGPGREAMGA